MKARSLQTLLLALAFTFYALSLSGQNNQVDTLSTTQLSAPVAPFNDTLFTIYKSIGTFNAEERASSTTKKIRDLSDNRKFNPDSLKIVENESSIDIVFNDLVVSTIISKDAKQENLSKLELAELRRTKIIEAIKQHRKNSYLSELLKQIGLTLAILAGMFFLVKYTNRFFKLLKNKIRGLKGRKLNGMSIRSYSLMDADKQTNLFLYLCNIIRYISIGLAIYLGISLLFKVFPATEHIADKLFGYIVDPIQDITNSIIAFIPNLITIIVIIIVFRYIIKGLGFLANEVACENIKINGFYPDWAKPTFNIVRAVLYAFMFIVIFPYLPGSDSGIFQGVSVFFGLIISLGSTSLISNIVAGLVLTYMRPFKKGDRIKIGDIVGNVVEKTPFVIRIRTPKNEEITIPNSNIMSAYTVNYSKSANDYGLIIYASVSIGYDTPWQQLHELLIQAASKTPYILEEPKPFVLQTALNDFYVEYQINAYTKSESQMAQIYSQLNQNIQDVFNEAGIEIMSPHYYAKRDGSKSTIPNNTNYNNLPNKGSNK